MHFVYTALSLFYDCHCPVTQWSIVHSERNLIVNLC